VHVAGTNGKGSVSAMLDAILHAAGWRTGLYTSPHLVKLGERVQVERCPLTEEEITAYVRELRPAAERVAAASAGRSSELF
jgi:dihydrofolate synthase/folylpolyglutamate synthase